MVNQEHTTYDLEAEIGTLGSMILNGAQVPKIKGIIPTSSYFYAAFHQIVYRVIVGMWDANIPLDIITIKDAVQKKNPLIPDIPERLMTIVEGTPTKGNGVYYAKIVKEKYLEREYMRLSGLVSSHTASGDKNAQQQAVSELQKLSTLVRDPPNLNTFLDEGIEGMRKRFSGPEMDFGILRLDAFTSGLQKGLLTVLGARESHGKTAIAIQATWRTLSISGKKVIYYSYDLAAKDIFCRMCLHGANKSTDIVWKSWGIDPAHRESEMNQLRAMGEEVAEAYKDKLLIREYNITRQIVESDLMAMRPDLIVIDYLQNALEDWGSGRKFFGEQAELRHFFTTLKDMTNKYNCATLLLSQFNRPEDRIDASRKPELRHYKGGGYIEQAANAAILLDYEYRRNPIRSKNEIDIKVAKVTFGATSGGWFPVYFDPPTQRFNNIEKNNDSQ